MIRDTGRSVDAAGFDGDVQWEPAAVRWGRFAHCQYRRAEGATSGPSVTIDALSMRPESAMSYTVNGGAFSAVWGLWRMITERVRARSDCLAVLTPARDSGQVPEKGKRRRRQEGAWQRLAARTPPDAGQWEVVVETSDQAEMRMRLRRLREEGVEGAMIRIDTLCGRLAVPTTYRLSRFVRDPARGHGHEHSDH
ncbi:hypothetical protein GCM10017562_73070 [Streptomyces roseofulvus]